MGATSYTGGRRFTRPRTRKDYSDWVRSGGALTVPETNPRDRLLETLMLGLRLAEGVSRSALGRDFGSDVKNSLLEVLQPHIERDLVAIDGDRVRLTVPEGFLFSNRVLRDLFGCFG
jgi:oxygen-independent coproporphyrinogen-3 oxidase